MVGIWFSGLDLATVTHSADDDVDENYAPAEVSHCLGVNLTEWRLMKCAAWAYRQVLFNQISQTNKTGEKMNEGPKQMTRLSSSASSASTSSSSTCSLLSCCGWPRRH